MSSKIKLITRGDDLGSTITANKAIMDAYKNGILKNTSIMVPAPFIEEAAALFAGEKDLCYGLHGTITAEWDNLRWGPVLPPAEVSSLVNEKGEFFQTTAALKNNKPKLEEIMRELKAQLNRARDLGFNIDYADMHMGFGGVVEGLEKEFGSWCLEEDLINYKYFNDPLPEAEGEDPVARFINQLKKTKPGRQYLIVGHPGYNNEEMKKLGHKGNPGNKVAPRRNWQRKIFMDDRVLDFIENNEIKPVKYTQADPF